MPDFSPAPAGGPEGALAWFNRSLGKVLGLSQADSTLPADQLSELVTRAQRQAIANVINGRFKRVLNEETGAVTIEQIGDPFVLVEPDEETDPVIAGLATNYLGAAKAAIAAVDAGQCIPGVCENQVAGLIQQIEATIDLVIAEAPTRSRTLQMYLHLHELTEPPYGLLTKLTKFFAGRTAASVDTLGREKAISSIRIAKRALGCFEEAIREIRAGDEEPTMGEVAEIALSCGAHVANHVRNVRSALRGAGVGECEIRAVELPIDGPVQLSGECFDTVSLDQALHALETETIRWRSLIAQGDRASFDTLLQTAQVLRPIVAAIDPDAILVGLGILDAERPSEPREAFAMGLSFSIARLRQYTLPLLDTILRESVLPGRTRRKGPQRKPPRNEAAPMKA